MKFLSITILALVASCQGDDKGKRGVAEYSPQQIYAQAPQATAGLAYTKQLQPALLAAQKTVEAAPQAQYYTQQAPVKYAAAPVQYSATPVQQQQYQYETQPVAYAQQPAVAKYASAPVVSKQVPHYSLANDVSSFAYSSPIVTYNNLGLLTQIVGKAAGAPAPAAKVAYASPATASSSAATTATKYAYAPAPSASVPAAPAPAAYQSPVQKLALAYSAAPSKISAAQAQQYINALPQQQYVSASPQQQYVSASQYSAPQAYRITQASAVPQGYTLSQLGQDNSQYSAESTDSQAYSQAVAAQPSYTQQQYYSAPQSKYASSEASYAQ